MAKPMLAYLPYMQFLDTDGTVLSGGSVYIYLPGTTTLLDSYPTSADAIAGTNANPNPIVLDSAGRPQNSNVAIDVYVTRAYKMVVKDSDGTTIRTIDNIPTTIQQIVTSEKTSNYTVTIQDKDKLFLVDSTNADVTISLPTAASAGDGFKVTIKKMDNSQNTITVDGNSSETIDGSTTITLTQPYSVISVVSDGSEWISEQFIPSITPVSTSVDYQVLTSDRNKLILVTPTAASRTITLPAVADIEAGFSVSIKKTDTSVNTVTVDGSGAETIDGSANIVLRNPYDHVKVTSTGTAWVVEDYDLKIATSSKSADYTVLASDNGKIFLVDSTAASRTITLPAATVAAGFQITVKKMDTSSNTVTIARAGSDTIDGDTSAVLSQSYDSITVTSDGTSQWIKDSFKSFSKNISFGIGAGIVADSHTLGQLLFAEVTVAYTDIASAASKTLLVSNSQQQFKVRDVFRNKTGGTNYSGGGGDRNIILTDGTTTFCTISAANAQAYAGDWGDVGVLRTTSSVAGADLVFKYSGGAADYTAGSITFTVMLEKVA